VTAWNEFPPITLRKNPFVGPLRITLPKLPETRAPFIEIPVMVDWFSVPDEYLMHEAITNVWYDQLPEGYPHFFNPNMISISIANFERGKP